MTSPSNPAMLPKGVAATCSRCGARLQVAKLWQMDEHGLKRELVHTMVYCPNGAMLTLTEARPWQPPH